MKDREINLDDFIQVTRDMDDIEYTQFMELSGPDRIERVGHMLAEKESRQKIKEGFDNALHFVHDGEKMRQIEKDEK